MDRTTEIFRDDVEAMNRASERAKKYMNTFTDEELKAIVKVHCDYRLGRYVHGNRDNRVHTLLELAPDLHWEDLMLICQARNVRYSTHLGCDEVLMFACVDYRQLNVAGVPEIELDSVWEM